jgi:glycosyltransferase involved in cell wall biosynthesis
MHILFITAHKYLPQMRGGLQSSTDQLCLALGRRGHTVAVLAGLMPGGFFAIKCRIKMKIGQRINGYQVTRDTGMPYPVWYSWLPWDVVPYVVKKEKPDLIVVLQYQSVRMALAARQTGIPLLMQFADVEFDQLGGNLKELGPVPCVANSQFTAGKYRDAFALKPTVIYPFVDAAKYKINTTRQNITLINPHPKKGRDVAIEIALQCPEIPFRFVESWPLSPEERSELMSKIGGIPNIALSPPQAEMRKVYGDCKILLAPSMWEEAYGRVVTEAQISGIPVVASTRGGLPEAVGPGGVVLDPDQPIADWVAVVRKLWRDDSYYNALSAAAQIHAVRPELVFDHQLEAFEQAMREAASRPGFGEHRA